MCFCSQPWAQRRRYIWDTECFLQTDSALICDVFISTFLRFLRFSDFCPATFSYSFFYYTLFVLFVCVCFVFVLFLCLCCEASTSRNWIELNWIKLNYITLHYIIMRLTVCNSHKNFIRLSRSRRFRQTGNVASIGETQEVHTEFR